MTFVDRARALRKQMTPQETRLWLRLRALRPQGLHFRRQAPFKGYILDFVCFERRIAIEIDGAQHAQSEQAAHDARRDATLARADFLTLRFWNSDVNADIDMVVESILARAMEREAIRGWRRGAGPTPAAARRTLPMKGREGCGEGPRQTTEARS